MNSTSDSDDFAGKFCHLFICGKNNTSPPEAP